MREIQNMCCQPPAQLLQGCFALYSRVEKQHKRLSPQFSTQFTGNAFVHVKEVNYRTSEKRQQRVRDPKKRERESGLGHLSWICFIHGGGLWLINDPTELIKSKCFMSCRASKC